MKVLYGKRKCYIGDPCLVLSDSQWRKLMELIWRGSSADYDRASVDGTFFFMRSTMFGDGEYALYKNENRVADLPVDSGSLSVIPLELLDNEAKEKAEGSGAVVEVDVTDCLEVDGKFTFWPYTCDTTGDDNGR